MNEAKMTELAQAEDMAYFRADLCIYSPESYSLEEKKEICNDMMVTSSAISMPCAKTSSSCPGCASQAPGQALRLRRRVVPRISFTRFCTAE